MQRIAQIVQVKQRHIPEYDRIHAEVWPGVLETIAACNIHNYSIFRYNTLLFAYMEYHGDDYEADRAKMAADPVTQEWWKITAPMQQPMPDVEEGQWWKQLPEIFHTDGPRGRVNKRMSSVIHVKDWAIEEYERMHADTWPGVLAAIEDANIRNYSIYRYHHLLFSYSEYHGEDWEADTSRNAADAVSQEWWKITTSQLQPVPEAAEGAYDYPIPEVFHTD
jgi:L-rhamnose mutarotase